MGLIRKCRILRHRKLGSRSVRPFYSEIYGKENPISWETLNSHLAPTPTLIRESVGFMHIRGVENSKQISPQTSEKIRSHFFRESYIKKIWRKTGGLQTGLYPKISSKLKPKIIAQWRFILYFFPLSIAGTFPIRKKNLFACVQNPRSEFIYDTRLLFPGHWLDATHRYIKTW